MLRAVCDPMRASSPALSRDKRRQRDAKEPAARCCNALSARIRYYVLSRSVKVDTLQGCKHKDGTCTWRVIPERAVANFALLLAHPPSPSLSHIRRRSSSSYGSKKPGYVGDDDAVSLTTPTSTQPPAATLLVLFEPPLPLPLRGLLSVLPDTDVREFACSSIPGGITLVFFLCCPSSFEATTLQPAFGSSSPDGLIPGSSPGGWGGAHPGPGPGPGPGIANVDVNVTCVLQLSVPVPALMQLGLSSLPYFDALALRKSSEAIVIAFGDCKPAAIQIADNCSGGGVCRCGLDAWTADD